VMDTMENIEPAEKYEALNQMIAPHLYGMFVTPKDIDETIARLGLLISEALNILFAENIGEAKIDAENAKTDVENTKRGTEKTDVDE